MVSSRDGDVCGVVHRSRDEASVNHHSGGGVVFANRVTLLIVVCHEEAIGRQCECVTRQPRDETGINGAPCGGVVFANRANVRDEETVARHSERDGIAQPRDEVRVNQRSLGGVFAHGSNLSRVVL